MESGVAWLLIVLFGAYHGVNPGMGWLFALSAGLQAKSERALWLALGPIALGHAASVGLFALVVLVGLQFLPMKHVQVITGVVLLAFGVYKLFNWYRHPRWVGMKVGMGRLFLWSFLMATAHGAGLMVAPALTQVAAAAPPAPASETRPSKTSGDVSSHELHARASHGPDHQEKGKTETAPAEGPGVHEAHAEHLAPLRGGMIWLGVLLHTLAMLLVMGTVALIVYRKLGLAVLRRAWVNFDLIWAMALLVVGGLALIVALI